MAMTGDDVGAGRGGSRIGPAGDEDRSRDRDARRDDAVRAYRSASALLDERASGSARSAVLAEASRAVGARPHVVDGPAPSRMPRRPALLRFRLPMAAAATVLVSVVAVLVANRTGRELAGEGSAPGEGAPAALPRVASPPVAAPSVAAPSVVAPPPALPKAASPASPQRSAAPAVRASDPQSATTQSPTRPPSARSQANHGATDAALSSLRPFVPDPPASARQAPGLAGSGEPADGAASTASASLHRRRLRRATLRGPPPSPRNLP
jgi:hypothetical protein